MKMKKIKELKNLVTIRKIEGETVEYLFVDLKNLSSSTSTDPNVTALEMKPDVPYVWKTRITLENKISENDLIDELFECIKELADKNESEKFILKDKSDLGIILRNSSHYIASNGRIGEATHLLISEKNFYYYNVKKELIDNLKDINVIFSDTIKNDIILYRVNSFDRPGLVLIHNKDKYIFEGIGFYPERQFQKITLGDLTPLEKNLDFKKYLDDIKKDELNEPIKMDDLKKDFMEKLILYCKTTKHGLLDFESFNYIKVNVEFFKDKPSGGFSFWFDNEIIKNKK